MVKKIGYWKNFENVKIELLKIIDDIGKFPTAAYLRSIGLSSISREIQNNGGVAKIAQELGISCKERPKKYWDNKNNLIKEANILIDKYGYLPSQIQLTELGLSSLNHSARKLFGGLTKFRTFLGVSSDTKPPGHWCKESILEVYDKLKDELGYPPSHKELKEKEGGGVLDAIQNIYGGLNNIKKELGDNYKKIINKSYWDNKYNIVDAINRVKHNLGHLPNFKELSDNDLCSLRYYICNNYDGIESFYSHFGYEYSGNKKFGYWKDKNNFYIEANKIIDMYGQIPTSRILTEKGHISFLNAATNYHGGIKKIRYELSGIIYKRGKEYWLEWDNVKNALKSIIKEIGHFPSWDEVNLSEHMPVYVLSNFGGINEIMKKMGYTSKVRVSLDGHENDSAAECLVDDMLYKNRVNHDRNITLTISGKNVIPDFILGEKLVLEVLMADYREKGKSKREIEYISRYIKKKKLYESNDYTVLEIFPKEINSKKQFTKAMNRILLFLEKKEIPESEVLHFSSKRGFNYWADFSNLEKELRPLCEKLKRFPSRKELKEFKSGHLNGAIAKHGGTEVVANKLGFPCFKYNAPKNGKKPSGYWKDDKNLKFEIDKEIINFGHFPTQKEMNNALAVAISRRGGIKKVKQYFGYKT